MDLSENVAAARRWFYTDEGIYHKYIIFKIKQMTDQMTDNSSGMI